MSKRLLLFSQPSPLVLGQLKLQLFPNFLPTKILGYMPSDGSNLVANAKYTPFWHQFAKDNHAVFLPIDNSQRGKLATLENKRLLSANILLITGGNTFTLLNHLRQSGLDQAIIKFWQKNDVVIAGFSAGAIVLTPTIQLCQLPNFDQNLVGITDLSGLNLVDFEVWPHFHPSQQNLVTDYQLRHPSIQLTTISDDQIIILDK